MLLFFFFVFLVFVIGVTAATTGGRSDSRSLAAAHKPAQQGSANGASANSLDGSLFVFFSLDLGWRFDLFLRKGRSHH